MKRFLGSFCALLLVGGCAGNVKKPAASSPSESATEEQPRLWVSEKDGKHSVVGYVERSGTGNSIYYDLEIQGAVYLITIGEHDGDLVGQSGAPLHGESLRTGYLDVPDGPDTVSFLFEKPRLFHLTVQFEDVSALSATFSRDKEARHVDPPMPVEDESGFVDVQCPRSDVGGGGTAWGPVTEAYRSPEEALRQHLRKHSIWPRLPDLDEFTRARVKGRWAPMIYREGGRTLAVVRTFKSPKGWGVKYVYACDSAMN